MESQNFGEYLKSLRLERGLTLREFSRAVGKDAGNISKLERGLLSPPRNKSTILDFGRILGVSPESEIMKNLIQLAAIGAGQIPKEALNDEELLEKLPILFRTATGSKIDRKKIIDFMESLRKS